MQFREKEEVFRLRGFRRPSTTSTKTLQQFLASWNFTDFIPKICKKIPFSPWFAKEIENREQNHIEFKWKEPKQLAIDELTNKLLSAPILGYADFSLSFELHELGGVLCQKQDGQYEL